MSDTYCYFQCLNVDCNRAVVIDVRIKDGGKEFVAMTCPLFAVPMDYDGCAAADADGYHAKWEISVGRESDPGYPTREPMVFVPRRAP